MRFYKYFTCISCQFFIFVSFFGWYCLLTFHISYGTSWKNDYCLSFLDRPFPLVILSLVAESISIVFSLKFTNWLQNEKTHLVIVVGCLSWHLSPNAKRSWWKRTLVQGGSLDHWPARLLSLAGFLGWLHTGLMLMDKPGHQVGANDSAKLSSLL